MGKPLIVAQPTVETVGYFRSSLLRDLGGVQIDGRCFHGAVFRFCVCSALEEWGLGTLRVCLFLRG